MRGRRAHAHDTRGLSEIVGTLMLVVIVVGAATVFSVFVANYEKQYDAQQALLHDEELEKIDILSIDPILSTSKVWDYANLSFIAESLDVNTIQVIQIAVNGDPLAYYNVSTPTSGTPSPVCDICVGVHQTFNLTSQEEVTISASLSLYNSGTNPTGGLYAPYTLTTSDYVAISVYTSLGNDFNRVFIPPTAVILTSQTEIYSGSEYVPVLELSGEDSVNPANATVASWNWSISPTPVGGSPNYEGEIQLIPQSEFTSGSYNITLTVEDTDELYGTTNMTYIP